MNHGDDRTQQLSPHSTREVERKFRVHGRFELPRIDHISGVGQVDDQGIVGLTATYFDTDDLRLVRDGSTLRRRTGGRDAGWHLKVPTKKAGVRDEIQLPLDGGDVPPRELTDIVAVIIRRAPVASVATLRTDRHTWGIRDDDGELIAEIVDDNVSVVSPDGATTARFRELELELAGMSDGLAAEVADLITAAGATEGRFVAKVVRALGPRAAEESDVPAPRPLSTSDPAGACVRAHAAKQVRALRRHDVGFRRDPAGQVDHVHQMRVAARRLRSGLRVFRPLLDDEWANDLSGELRWLAHGLTHLREAEVILPLLEGAINLAIVDEGRAAKALDAVRAEFDSELAEARSEAMSVLTSDRYFDLHDALVEAANHPHLTERADAASADVLPPLVQAAWQRLERAATSLTDNSPDEQWHKVRLAAKRARYAGEAVAPALGEPAVEYARQIERLTDVLGEHQDAADATRRASDMAGRHSGEVATDLAFVAGMEMGAAVSTRNEFRRVWLQVQAAVGGGNLWG